MDFRIELLPLPVTDVDAAIAFYVERAGFTLDHDHRVAPGLRFVQITPGTHRSLQQPIVSQ